MADDVSKARSQLHHVREMQQERAAEFWQQTILLGRMQRPADAQMDQQQRPEQKPRQPRQ